MIAHEVFQLSPVLDLDARLPTLSGDLEGPMLHVALDFWVISLSSDESFGVEHGVFRVGVECILSGVTDESLVVCEGDP